MFTAQRPTRKVNTQLSRSLRQERTKLGLSTAPQSPPPIHINPKIPQPFELDQTINTNSTSKQSLPESLPELNPTSTILSEIRERTPALLKVPTINDKLGLNLLRLAESNSINNVQDTWSLQSVRSTQSNTNYTNYNNNHNNYNNDTEVISKVEPYFAKDGNVEHARHVGKEVLDTLRAVLDQYKYKPNNNIETPPPGQVTRTCFDALKTLQDTMTGPVQSLLSQAFAILEHAAYVNPTFIKERLIPLNVIPPIKPSSIPTMTPSTPTTTPTSNSTTTPATPTPTPTTIPSLLHTEAVILLQQATFTATQQLNQWQQQEKNSKIKLNTIQTELEQLTKNETSMRLQLTSLLRKEGSTTNERNGLVQKEKKLLTELKHARMASHEAEKEEQILKTKRNFLEDEYTNVREELQYEEDKLRRTQMTIDTNVVPRTEVMEVRSQIVTMKATLNEYKVVHERLKARSMKEHDVHCAIQSDLKVAIQERRALEEEHKELQRTHTPRPEWDRIMDLCPELRRKVHERVFDAISNHHNTTAKKQNTLDSNGTTNAATDNTTDNSDNSDKSDNNNNNSSISTDLNTTSEKASTTTTTLKPTAMYSTARSKPRQSMVTPSGLSIGKTHGSSAFTSLVVTAKKHDDTILQSIVQQSNSNAFQSTHSTQPTSSALQSDWRPKIHDATELLTLDLIALIETNRTKNIELLELEGTLRELGVVELKKICQDTKRHIIETERMIDDVRKTQEKVATSSTHKALVGGDKHTILEGQFFQGVGNHPQVPRFLRWSGKVRKRGIQKGELWSLTDRVWKARIKQRKKYDEYLKSLSDENNNGSTTSTSKKKPMNSFGRIKKKTKPPIKPEESFAEFFYNWLFHRHKSHQLVVEWGYNVMAGLEIYMWDAHLELFLLCLTGAVTEDTVRFFVVVDCLCCCFKTNEDLF